MAWAVCVPASNEHPDKNKYQGDIIQIISDEDYATYREPYLSKFDFHRINGTKEQVEAKIREYKPWRSKVFYDNDTLEWVWDIPYTEGETAEEYKARIGGIKKVWSAWDDGNRWYEEVVRWRHFYSLNTLTQQELDFIADPGFDIDHPANDAYVRKAVRNFADLVGNDVEVVDVRNTQPPGGLSK